MAAESCLGAPVLALEVQSVDVSDDSSISGSEAELLVPSDDDILSSPKCKYLQDVKVYIVRSCKAQDKDILEHAVAACLLWIISFP